MTRRLLIVYHCLLCFALFDNCKYSILNESHTHTHTQTTHAHTPSILFWMSHTHIRTDHTRTHTGKHTYSQRGKRLRTKLQAAVWQTKKKGGKQGAVRNNYLTLVAQLASCWHVILTKTRLGANRRQWHSRFSLGENSFGCSPLKTKPCEKPLWVLLLDSPIIRSHFSSECFLVASSMFI